MIAEFKPRDDAIREAIRNDVAANMCVEAGAGTGKTTVLVDRIVHILRTTETRADEIAVITFTEKAAAELASRVRRGLEDALAGDPTSGERERIEAALRDLNRAHIETIHAFAASLLRERPVEAGLDPGFEVLDEMPERLAFDTAWGEWLAGQMSHEPPPPALLEALKLNLQPKNLRDAADRLNRHRDVLPLAAYDDDPADLDAFLDDIAEVADQLGGLNPRMRDETDDAYVAIPTYIEEADKLLALREYPDALAQAITDNTTGRINKGRQENWFDRDDCRDAKKAMNGIVERVGEVAGAMRRNATGRLVLWAQDFVGYYERQRQAAGQADFDDLLIWARNLVRDNEEVRAYFASKYSRILVDEFQDTDPLQAEMIIRICADDPVGADWREARLRPGSLFVVGDPKQSIYRFRRADIAMYDDVKRRVFRGEPRAIVQNFRSSGPIIAWINDIFGRLIAEDAGVQPSYIALEPKPDIAALADAVILVDGEGGGTAPGIRRSEADAIASLIAREAHGGSWCVRDGDGERPAIWRDVVVLVPNRTDLFYYEEALARAGVPYRHEGGRTFFARQEVRELVAVLRAMDDPSDGVATIAALRSSAFGCSDEELLLYRDGARIDSAFVSPDTQGHVAESLRTLRWLAEKRFETPLPELVRMVLDDTRLVEFAMLQPQGDEVAANLLKIIDQARAFVEARGGGLRSFVRWLRDNVTRASDPAAAAVPEAEASISEETDDVVRIMTVHASKGLEFPVVVFANMETRRNESTNVIVSRGGDGPAFHARLGAKDKGFETPGYDVAEAAELRHKLAEEQRLLYVAATRARDRLVIPLFGPVAAKKSGANPVGSLNDHLRQARVAGTGTHIDAATLPAPASELPVWRRGLDDAGESGVRAVIEAREAWIAAHEMQVDVAAAGLRIVTASSLKDGWERPDASEEAAVRRGRAADFGSAVHAVLERIDFARPDDVPALARAVAAEVGLSDRAEEIESVTRQALSSDAVARATRSRRALREVAFTAPLPDTDGLPAGLAEGRIDLLFEEEGGEGPGIVIVDFKTDDVRGSEIDARAAEYRTQALVYAWAAHEATGLPVREVIFVFARPGQERAFVVDAEFRGEAEALMRAPVLADAT